MFIMDGGVGQELVKRNKKTPTPLWSAMAALEDPEILTNLHREFLEAGARLVTLNTYASTRQRLRRNGIEDVFQKIHHASMECALRARDTARCAHRADVKIAVCLPPLMASYHPQTHPSIDEARDSYREIIALHEDKADLVLAETMSSLAEGRDVVAASKECKLPLWLSFTLDDDDGALLRSGEQLAQAIELRGHAEAVLINCSVPEVIADGLNILTKTGLPMGAYANGFTSVAALKPGRTVATLKARQNLGPDSYADFVDQWVNMGASIIGGCCEIGPAHIAELAKRHG